MAESMHGGTDALGVPAHDFSTNRNACGPCPAAVAALQAAHAAQYPDPLYTGLRARLAAFHAVEQRRILVGGSGSELIHRFSQHAVRSGAGTAALPRHHYGDYAQAARIWGLQPQPRGELHWLCEPSSPLGRLEEGSADEEAGAGPRRWPVIDCAYRPLWLEGGPPPRDLDRLWQLWTPNKALGMTGVRAAYAIAPALAAQQELDALRELAPSWVVGAHGVAMLQAGRAAKPSSGWRTACRPCAAGSAGSSRCASGWAGRSCPATRPITLWRACPFPRRCWRGAWSSSGRRASSCATAPASACPAMCAWACCRPHRRPRWSGPGKRSRART